MTLFQGLLVLFLLIFVVYIIRFKNATYDRLFMVVIGTGGIVFVLYPELSSNIAKFFNIGRGTDLVFYMWIIFTLFKFLRYEARINELQKSLTLITRHVTISEGKFPEPTNNVIQD